MDRVFLSLLRGPGLDVWGLVIVLGFLNMDGGRRACMLIRERRFERGVCGGDNSLVAFDWETRCSTSAAEAAGAERSLFLVKASRQQKLKSRDEKGYLPDAEHLLSCNKSPPPPYRSNRIY